MPVKLGILSNKVENSSLEKLIIFNNSCLLENENISSNQIDQYCFKQVDKFQCFSLGVPIISFCLTCQTFNDELLS